MTLTQHRFSKFIIVLVKCVNTVLTWIDAGMRGGRWFHLWRPTLRLWFDRYHMFVEYPTSLADARVGEAGGNTARYVRVWRVHVGEGLATRPLACCCWCCRWFRVRTGTRDKPSQIVTLIAYTVSYLHVIIQNNWWLLVAYVSKLITIFNVHVGVELSTPQDPLNPVCTAGSRLWSD